MMTMRFVGGYSASGIGADWSSDFNTSDSWSDLIDPSVALCAGLEVIVLDTKLLKK